MFSHDYLEIIWEDVSYLRISLLSICNFKETSEFREQDEAMGIKWA